MDDSSVKSRGDRIYQVIITLILIIFALCAILPFILLLSSSLTDEATLLKEGYAFIPRKFSAKKSPPCGKHGGDEAQTVLSST